jgi:hypothetical protein
MTPRSAAVSDLKATFSLLKGDLDAAVALGKRDDTQFARRTLIRTLFAFVEGLTNQLSSVAAASATMTSGILSSEELAALREESYEVDDEGRVRTRATQIAIRRRVRLALRCYPRIHGSTFTADFGGVGWEQFQGALRIRNRLTHPRTERDLSVSDADMSTVGAASGWYQDTVLTLLTACQAADDALSQPATG